MFIDLQRVELRERHEGNDKDRGHVSYKRIYEEEW